MFFIDFNIFSSGYLIYFGCFAATLSSAIASLVGAPRVLQVLYGQAYFVKQNTRKKKKSTQVFNQQALAADKLYPKIEFFAKGYGPGDCIVFTFLKSFIIWST